MAEKTNLGKALNVYGVSGISSGRNVCLYNDDDTDPMQEWVLKSKNGDFYFCNSTRQNFVLDRSSGVTGSPRNNAHICSTGMTAINDYAVVMERVYENIFVISLRDKSNYGDLCLTAMNSATPTSGTISYLDAPGNVCWAKRDGSGEQRWIVEEVPEEGQKLIMPINQATITDCYKENAPAYHEQGFADPMHYAVDMVGSPQDFYASGNGVIVGYSKTNSGPLGKWLAVRYDNVEGTDGTRYNGVILRYCHLDQIYKTEGEVHINDANAMARYGNTGTSKEHLHVEVDTDINNPNKTPTIKKGSNGLIPAGDDDTTIDPFLIFHKKISKPELQTVKPSQSYCDIQNCSICKTYTQYEEGKVPYVNEQQCYDIPSIE